MTAATESRQLGGHVDHGLALGDEPLGDMTADAFTALDRPDPVRPGPRLRLAPSCTSGVGNGCT